MALPNILRIARITKTCSALIFLITAAVTSAQELGTKSILVVHADEWVCPDASFYSIQDAVAAAEPGDTIHICAGQYVEQVIVTKPLKLAADEGVVVTPSHMVQSATSLSTGEPLAVGILVRDTKDVQVYGFSLDLSKSELRGCTPRLVGILFQNASGAIGSNHLLHTRLKDSLSACESGSGIEVQSGLGGQSKVAIENNSVDDFQRDAIAGSGTGTELDVEENEIISSGSGDFRRNGIQIGFGATGTIDENIISGGRSKSASDTVDCAAVTVGISVFGSDGVVVTENAMGTEHAGIFVAGNRSQITRNNFFRCPPAKAIQVFGDENEIIDNEIPAGTKSAVVVEGKGNQVERNDPSVRSEVPNPGLSSMNH